MARYRYGEMYWRKAEILIQRNASVQDGIIDTLLIQKNASEQDKIIDTLLI